ncbi:MAG: hypothetical protein A2017_07595 [Lentisphaerae bacterium GWF2_44_16]|nr:MAG: hypothetical protein A2017_07595 [Lentisphaerae bacterium GWF2_44_16]
MHTPPPFLSIIICGRNDNHNGDFNKRAEYAVRHNTALLNEFKINYEFVWVEWNSLNDIPLFFEKIKEWTGNCRALVVPEKIHRLVSRNPNIGVMQFHAKNVGIRRATGSWIISTNADTYFSKEIVKKIAEGNFEQDKCYIANRLDFKSGYLMHGIEKFPVEDLDTRELVYTFSPDFDRSFGAPGDFTMMHRNLFFEMQAHYEGVRCSNQHLDTVLCRKLQSLGHEIVPIGNVYHADHADSWLNMKQSKHHGGVDYAWQHIAMPYKNASAWGLASLKENNIRPNHSVLLPPAGISEKEIIHEIPEALILHDQFFREVHSAIDSLCKSGSMVLFYGIGKDFESEFPDGLPDLKIVGIIDDNPPSFNKTFAQIYNSEDITKISFDAVVISSWWWCYDLAVKLTNMGLKSKIYPAFLRNTDKMRDVFEPGN